MPLPNLLEDSTLASLERIGDLAPIDSRPMNFKCLNCGAEAEGMLSPCADCGENYWSAQ